MDRLIFIAAAAASRRALSQNDQSRKLKIVSKTIAQSNLKWLWHRWQGSRFQNQCSEVRILSILYNANFHEHFEENKNKEATEWPIDTILNFSGRGVVVV